jgi:muramoyltetrapeptide carboxypeptidase
MKLIKPKALKSGDTLGIVAFSTPIHASSEETIQRSCSFLKEKGFNIIEAPNCRTMTGHTAGTIKERVKSLHDFFKNKKIDGILSYWGGFQSHQLLEYLDFDLIRRNPKPFIGFSDTTILHAGIHGKTGLVTFSGPAGITFGKPTVPDFTWKFFEKVLMQPEATLKLEASETFSDNKWYMEPSKQMRFEPNPGWKVYRKGKAEGAVFGGNVGTLLLLAGTPYWVNLKGRILFVEDDEAESSKTMDRMFTQLRQMGVYDQIKGMVVGRFHRDVAFKENDSLEMILDDALRGYKFPVITGVDFGRTDPLITIPMGIRCRMDTAKKEITYLESAVVK